MVIKQALKLNLSKGNKSFYFTKLLTINPNHLNYRSYDTMIIILPLKIFHGYGIEINIGVMGLGFY